jgi:transposase
VARQSALKARTQAANELHALVVTSPEAIREQLGRRRLAQLVKPAAAFRLSKHQLTTPTAATKMALKSLAMRYQHLSAEIDTLDKHLAQLVAEAGAHAGSDQGCGHRHCFDPHDHRC